MLTPLGSASAVGLSVQASGSAGAKLVAVPPVLGGSGGAAGVYPPRARDSPAEPPAAAVPVKGEQLLITLRSKGEKNVIP